MKLLLLLFLILVFGALIAGFVLISLPSKILEDVENKFLRGGPSGDADNS